LEAKYLLGSQAGFAAAGKPHGPALIVNIGAGAPGAQGKAGCYVPCSPQVGHPQAVGEDIAPTGQASSGHTMGGQTVEPSLLLASNRLASAGTQVGQPHGVGLGT